MNSRARIAVVFGTRPEAIKLVPVIQALARDPRFEPRVCVTGQHRGMLDQVLGFAGVTPDHDLALMRPGQSLDALAAGALAGIGAVLDRERPARVLVQGDTVSALAGALAAHHRRLPVDHVEAGLRSRDPGNPWPEEVNRKLVSHIASLHFAPTQAAARALHDEGIAPARVHLTGNTGIDALLATAARLAADPGLAAGLDALAARFAGRRIVAVTTHRRENLDGGIARIAAAIARLARRGDIGVIVPLHPNPEVRDAIAPPLARLDAVALIEPLDYPHFVRLLQLADLVLTDSGGVQEEAPVLGKPVLVMRDTTERPEGPAAGTARLVGTDPAVIEREVARLLDDRAAYAAMARAHNPYGDGHAAARIVAALARELALPG